MQSVNEKGVEKTKKILKQGIENGYETTDRIMSYTIQLVCKNFQISESELFLGRSRKNGTRTQARAMLIYMVYKIYGKFKPQVSRREKTNRQKR